MTRRTGRGDGGTRRMQHAVRVGAVGVIAAGAIVAQDVLLPAPLLRTGAPPFGEAPVALLVGDVDGDGARDLLTPTAFRGVTWRRLPGAWDGVVTDLGAGGFVRAAGVGDLDGDGRADLVLARVGGDLERRLSDGAGGTPLTSVTSTNGLSPRAVLVGDVDGDGDADAGLVDFDDAALYLSLGDGAGGGIAAFGHAMDGTPRAARLADVDADGQLDLVAIVAGLAGDAITVRSGDGLGGFGSSVTTPLPDSPRAFDCGDLDEDGVIDLAVTFVDALAVASGDGAGGFALGPAVPSAWQGVGVADLDADGHLDVVTVDGEVVVHAGGGDGSLTAGVVTSAPGFSAVTLAELTGDGLIDAVVQHPTEGAIVLAGHGVRGFRAPRITALAGPSGVASDRGDLDGDGELDVVVASGFDASVETLLQTGQDVFASAEVTVLGEHAFGVALGDLDLDGALDAVVTQDDATGSLAVLSGDGAGGLAPRTSVDVHALPRAVVVADLDDDGLLDLACVNQAADDVTVVRSVAPGAFGQPRHYATGDTPQDLELGDLDGDGDLDVAVRDHNDGTITLLANTGTSALTPLATLPVGNKADHLALGDRDADGDAEVAALAGGSHVVQLFDEVGGVWSQVQTVSLTYASSGPMAFGDVDGDALPDLVVATNVGLATLRNRAGTAFDPPSWSAAGAVLRELEIADLHDDGLADVFGPGSDGAFVVAPSATGPWWNVGPAGVPAAGALALRGAGALTPGAPTTLSVAGAGASVTLVIGVAPLVVPLKGATLVPAPDLLITLPTDADGGVEVALPWPVGVPPGVPLWLQAWSSTGAGWSVSDGLQAVSGG